MSTLILTPTPSPFIHAVPSQGGLDFPAPLSLAEKYQPQGFDDFVGLEKVRAFLSQVAVHPPSRGGLVFVGPSGTGKTSMGFALARAMKAELHVIPARTCDLATLTRLRYSCNFVPMYGYRRHLVLIEEADRMSLAAQECLLSELDGSDATPLTTFVFTCNDTSVLQDRFLSRNRVIDFSSYGMAKAAADRLEYIWDVETNIATPKPNFARLVKESNNNIRAALMALEWEMGTRTSLAA